MTKRVTTDDLSAYLDGELSEDEMQRVRAEIASDPEAARLLEELGSVDDSVRRAPSDPPEAYFDALPGRIRARLAVPAKTAWRPPVWSLAAAAALFVAVLTPLALRDRPSPVAEPAPPAAAKPIDGDASREAPAASAPPGALAVATPAPAVGRTEADARSLRDEEPPKRRDRVPAAESRVQSRPAPAVEPEEKLQSKDEAANTKLKADVAAGEAQQQDFAQPPRQAANQEFGPRVNQQIVAPASGPMKKEAPAAPPPPPAAASPPPTAPPAAAGFEESVTVTTEQAKNVAGLRARTAPATPKPMDFLSRRAATASEARSLREEARRFAEANPGDSRADAARVRVVELGTDAWRREGLTEDRDRARVDAAAYLAREDARQKDRVRRLLETLSR